jgi:GNAT superfamily N-acetyltransferase
MEIRVATTADFEDIQLLFRLVDKLHFEAMPGLFRETAEIERSGEFLTELIEDEAGLFLVADVNGRVVGLIQAKYDEQTSHPFLRPYSEIYINDMVVDESLQGSGVAQTLMDRVITWAKEKGVDRLRLQVFEFNQRAQAFYAKQGFVTRTRRMSLELGN